MLQQLSIRDIAAMAGVSVSTVSRVINKSGYVAEKTAARVKAVIDQMGYMPSAAARELRGVETEMVGILVSENIGEFMLELITALQKALQQQGFTSVLVNTSGVDNLRETYLYMQNRLNLAGWFHVLCESFADPIRIPTVVLCRPSRRAAPASALLAHVNCDDVRGGYLAARELIEKGCRRIAIINHHRRNIVLEDDDVYSFRTEGALQAMRENGIEPDPSLISFTDVISYQEGYEQAQVILNAPGHIDGIFCTADRYVPGVLEALSQRGLRVPEDIRLIGFGDNPISKVLSGGFSTVRINVEELAEQAVASFLSLRQGGPTADKLTGIELIRRHTT